VRDCDKSPVKYHYFFLIYSVRRSACSEGLASQRSWCSRTKRVRVARDFGRSSTIIPRDPIRGYCQTGSLTEVVYLSKNNVGVLRLAQRRQKYIISRGAKGQNLT